MTPEEIQKAAEKYVEETDYITDLNRNLAGNAFLAGYALAAAQGKEREKVMREALERIEGMSERPVCICGVTTGTAAIKHCAEKALAELGGGE